MRRLPLRVRRHRTNGTGHERARMRLVAGRSLMRDALARLAANKAAMSSLVLLIMVMMAVLIGPWLSPNDYISQDYDQIWAAPTTTGGHLFGTDSVGRDLF